MMVKKFLGFPLAVLASAALVTACGGGGDDQQVVQPPAVPALDGLYDGKAGTREFSALVLDDGRVYTIYTNQGATRIGGVVVARGNASDGKYVSTVMKDFSIEGEAIGSGAIAATYVPKASFNGTTTYMTAGFTGHTFAGTYNKSYELAPSVAAIAGTYNAAFLASTGDGGASSLRIASDGTLSTSEPGCATTGTIAPRPKGNVFNVTVTSTGVGCVFPGVSLAGIAYYDTTRKSLIAVVHTGDLGKGWLAAGVKP
jgi:hypothetical protein